MDVVICHTDALGVVQIDAAVVQEELQYGVAGVAALRDRAEDPDAHLGREELDQSECDRRLPGVALR